MLFGVAGAPEVVEASLSPAMHNAAFAAQGIDARYVPIPLEPDQAEQFLRELGCQGFRGINVTMPYKPLACRVANTRSEAVLAAGVANTLLVEPAGIHAEATDGQAVVDALADRGVKVRGARLVLIGAGGAAREVAYACAAEGAAGIALWNRTTQRAEQLAEELQNVFPDLNLELCRQLPIHVPANALISAVPQEALAEVAGENMPADRVVVDMAYRRDGTPTHLVRAAHNSASACVDGREILVRQGAASFRCWFGREAPTEVMRSAVT